MTKTTQQTSIDVGSEMAAAKKSGNGVLAQYNSQDLASLFDRYKLQIAQALPKHLSADRMIQMATILCAKNPALKDCSVASVIGAVMQASILGFRPVQALGQCYFVPYRNKGVMEVQFQIGYKGYIALARNSGQIESISAECVYKGDKFNYELGLNPSLSHVPSDESDRSDFSKITHAYAVARYKDGGHNFIVLNRRQIERLRLRNASQKAGSPSMAWATDYDKMAIAKAIKQLARYMPLSDEIQLGITADEAIIKPEDFVKGGELGNVTYPEAEDAESIDVTDQKPEEDDDDSSK